MADNLTVAMPTTNYTDMDFSQPANLQNVGSTPVADMGPAFQAQVAPVMDVAPDQQITVNPQLLDDIHSGAGMLPEMAPAVSSGGGLLGDIMGAASQLTADVADAGHSLAVLQPEAPVVSAPVGDTALEQGQIKLANESGAHEVKYTADVPTQTFTPSNGM